MLINPLTLLGFAPSWLKYAAVVLTLAASFVAYDKYVDDPAVARAARQGYVEQMKLEVALEVIKNLKTQLEQNKQILERFRGQIAQSEEARRKNLVQTEQEIQNYERLLADAGRSCRLDKRDIDWLRKS